LSKHFLTLLEYNSIELHPLIINATWYLSIKELSLALHTPIVKIIESLELLVEGKHYSYEAIEYARAKSTSSILFFSKAGIMKLSYHLKTEDALSFLEFIEDIYFEDNNQEVKTHNFYNDIEDLLKDRLKALKENPDASLEEINRFIITLDNLIRKRDNLPAQKTVQNGSNFGDILETVVQLAQNYAVKK